MSVSLLVINGQGDYLYKTKSHKSPGASRGFVFMIDALYSGSARVSACRETWPMVALTDFVLEVAPVGHVSREATANNKKTPQ